MPRGNNAFVEDSGLVGSGSVARLAGPIPEPYSLPPTPPAGSLRRSVLLTRLRAAAGNRVVVLSAPAGYGKSTVLAQWAAEDPRPFRWLTVTDEHNDPDRLRSDVDRLVRVRTRHRPMIGSPRDVTQIASRGSWPVGGPCVLVVDDAHVLTAEPARHGDRPPCAIGTGGIAACPRVQGRYLLGGGSMGDPATDRRGPADRLGLQPRRATKNGPCGCGWCAGITGRTVWKLAGRSRCESGSLTVVSGRSCDGRDCRTPIVAGLRGIGGVARRHGCGPRVTCQVLDPVGADWPDLRGAGRPGRSGGAGPCRARRVPADDVDNVDRWIRRLSPVPPAGEADVAGDVGAQRTAPDSACCTNGPRPGMPPLAISTPRSGMQSRPVTWNVSARWCGPRSNPD